MKLRVRESEGLAGLQPQKTVPLRQHSNRKLTQVRIVSAVIIRGQLVANADGEARGQNAPRKRSICGGKQVIDSQELCLVTLFFILDLFFSSAT